MEYDLIEKYFLCIKVWLVFIELLFVNVYIINISMIGDVLLVYDMYK